MLHQKQETIPSIDKDLTDWHRGRRDYAVWLIEAGQEEIRNRVAAAKEHLSGYLLEPYRRQPHLTLFVCGFLADTRCFDDDYSACQLRVQTQSLRDAKVPPFFIEIGGLNSFSSAPFLEVNDLEGGINRVRTALSAAAKEIGRTAFTPHVTVGLYSGAFSSAVVARKIAAFPAKPVACRVERITFASYEAQEFAGALTYRSEVALLAE
jgi:2'-5' RNA ligase